MSDLNTTLLNLTAGVPPWNTTHGPMTRRTVGWTAMLVVKLLICISSLLLNAIVLAVHYFIPTYINPFSIYLLALFITNIVYLLIMRPIGILDELYGLWPASGFSLCVLYNYDKVMSMVPVMFHVLISFNRLWAVTFPVSYRERHTKQLAVRICLGALLAVHIVNLPAYLVDMLHIYPPFYYKIKDCHQILSPAIAYWNRVGYVVNRFSPLAFILVAYLHIIVKRWRQRRTGLADGNVKTASTPATDPGKPGGEREPVIVQRPRKETVSTQRSKIKPFVVLTLTSISVIICWLPADAYFFILTYLNVGFSRDFFIVISTLYSVQMIFDPLMWICSLRK
ncbi:octopamine receptor-like [Paramacrobiotus metropolitanus]|uniref:octopamine receptor-like n=1 Tax=Paramacrobiotus metropolitanus TaxID=2943436 RepID=UPI002445A30D|nr:octopamine receptor-like [Paramacrobiotus metropolitanus]